MPHRVGPPSSTTSTAPPSPATTCSARVGLSWPNRFALGAATGTPAAAISARADGSSGTRTAIVSRPEVTIGGMISGRSTIRVIGPGQNRFASSATAAGTSPTSAARSAASARWLISGSKLGRAFASKIRAAARASSALAPSP